jgi:hypothetical protein
MIGAEWRCAHIDPLVWLIASHISVPEINLRLSCSIDVLELLGKVDQLESRVDKMIGA